MSEKILKFNQKMVYLKHNRSKAYNKTKID